MQWLGEVAGLQESLRHIALCDDHGAVRTEVSLPARNNRTARRLGCRYMQRSPVPGLPWRNHVC